jgi:hypothetical protein
MATRARLFVSGGADQEPAREMLGRALAEIPVNVGWVIKRTPDVDSVAESHLWLLLLGSDIVAPVGLELWWAQRTEKPVLAYCADVLRTPAGQVFYQENAWLGWRKFNDLSHLRRLVLADLSRFLTIHAERYGLTLVEAEALRGFVARLDKDVPAAIPGNARGASGGGVILAPGKDEPPGARLLGEG